MAFYSFGFHTEEYQESLSLLIFLVALALAIVIANHVIGHKWNSSHGLQIPESGVTMVIGLIFGGLVRLGSLKHDEDFEDTLVVFSPTLFFLGLLPPIIFNEGYHLDTRRFFAHLTPIAVFSIIGTSISTLVTASMINAAKHMGMGVGDLTLAESATFGSLISATDPVAVLAVFAALRVEPSLFFIVFGESVLNDAVSLTLFNICSKSVESPPDTAAAAYGFLDFLIVMTGSWVVGWALGLGASLALKWGDMGLGGARVLEISLYAVLVYLPYIVAQVIGMSGIVAILAAGMTCKHYGHRNLSSDMTRELADFLFRMLSFLAENAVFLCLGLSVFGIPTFMASFNGAFILWAFFSCLVSRAILVFGLSAVLNIASFYSHVERIPWKTQVVMWFAGLRGAVAFAAASNFPDDNGNRDLMQATTMSLVLMFTFGVAPWTVPLLRCLKVDINVDYDRHSQASPLPANSLTTWCERFDARWIQPCVLSKDAFAAVVEERQGRLVDETEFQTRLRRRHHQGVFSNSVPDSSEAKSAEMRRLSSTLGGSGRSGGSGGDGAAGSGGGNRGCGSSNASVASGDTDASDPSAPEPGLDGSGSGAAVRRGSIREREELDEDAVTPRPLQRQRSSNSERRRRSPRRSRWDVAAGDVSSAAAGSQIFFDFGGLHAPGEDPARRATENDRRWTPEAVGAGRDRNGLV